MKSSADKTLLDDFIRKTLKSSDDSYTPFDWSELDVLLNHEQHTIPVKLNRKNLFLAGAVIGGILILIVIFKIANHYSSLPDEQEPALDSSQQVLVPIDSLSEAASQPDSLPKDTLNGKNTSDTVSSLNTILPADTSAVPKLKNVAPVPTPALSKKEKKKKSDTLQTKEKTDTIPSGKVPAPTPIDTTFRPAISETRIEPAPIKDSSIKTLPSGNAKKKKNKTKNVSPSPVTPKSDTPAVQPDSLKQQ